MYEVTNEEYAKFRYTGVFLRECKAKHCGFSIVLPSPELADQIDIHLKKYHSHNPVLQVPVNDRRAEALYTCLRGKNEYGKRISGLESRVSSAPCETKEEKAAKRKLEKKLSTMKRDGRGGVEEMLELYDLEKDSDTCRYVMDNDNVLLNLSTAFERSTTLI